MNRKKLAAGIHCSGCCPVTAGTPAEHVPIELDEPLIGAGTKDKGEAERG